MNENHQKQSLTPDQASMLNRIAASGIDINVVDSDWNAITALINLGLIEGSVYVPSTLHLTPAGVALQQAMETQEWARKSIKQIKAIQLSPAAQDLWMFQNRTKLSTDSSSLLQQAASDSAGLVWIPYSSNLFPIAQDLVEQGYLIAQVAGRMNAIPTYGGHPVASEMGISFKITPEGYNYLVSTGKSTKMATWADWIDILTGAPGTNSSLTNQAMHEVAQYIVDLVGGDENRIANWVRQNVQESDRDFPDAIVRRWQQQGKAAKEPQFSTMLIGGILQSVPPVQKYTPIPGNYSWQDDLDILAHKLDGDAVEALNDVYVIVSRLCQSNTSNLLHWLANLDYGGTESPSELAKAWDRFSALATDQGMFSPYG